eukprot:TRINITY_DN44523_c0_g1_i1.p1 TRINITY_DN44523_c0_g1~~TRINITY_DN44523_c0_g1_i1.p1  ORF type:complete len:177 (-),score=14.65 TRINITY_DN44523_c0_g1_i1:206-682(-)
MQLADLLRRWFGILKIACATLCCVHIVCVLPFGILVGIAYGSAPRDCSQSKMPLRCERARALSLGDVFYTMLLQALGTGGWVDLKHDYSNAEESSGDWCFAAAAYLGRFGWGMWAIITLVHILQKPAPALDEISQGVQDSATGIPIGRVDEPNGQNKV